MKLFKELHGGEYHSLTGCRDGMGGLGECQVDHEPALAAKEAESPLGCTELSQQVEGGDTSPLFSTGSLPPRLFCDSGNWVYMKPCALSLGC